MCTPWDNQELTGKSADLLEVLNLDEKGKTTREPVDAPLLAAVRSKIRDAGAGLRFFNACAVAANALESPAERKA